MRGVRKVLGLGASAAGVSARLLVATTLCAFSGRADTQLDLWGAGNSSGVQYGDDYFTRSMPFPVRVVDHGVKAISIAEDHSLLLKYDNTLWEIGKPQLGTANATGTLVLSEYTPAPRQALTGVAAMAAGRYHSAIIKLDGTLWMAGRNNAGQFGDGKTTLSVGPTVVMVASDVSKVAVGDGHTMILKKDGTLWVTGSNIAGQLGDGTFTDRNTFGQIASGVSAIAAGAAHSVWLKTDGTLWTAGSNSERQLGDGTSVNMRAAPEQIATGVTGIAAGAQQTRFLKNDGTLWAAGTNAMSQFGLGNYSTYLAPVQVTTGVVAASVAAYHSLYLASDGRLIFAGNTTMGASGRGDTQSVPTPVVMATDVVAFGAGTRSTFYIDRNGTLYSCGSPATAALGLGYASFHEFPKWVAPGVKTMSAGGDFSLWVFDNGQAWGAGSNSSGQTGPGLPGWKWVPQMILDGVSAVAAGGAHSLFLKTDGTLWSVGHNQQGQLGRVGSSWLDMSVPGQVASGVASISAGEGFSMFVKTDGTLWAMGNNSSGQLGDGSTSNRTTPVQVATGVRAVSAGTAHTLFVKTDGSLWAMGVNEWGQLGDGSTTQRLSPVQIMTGVAQASAGPNHSLVLKTDGTVWSMGRNDSRQLGDNLSIASRNVPAQVATGVSAVEAGDARSFWIKTDGSLWGVGDMIYGELGIGRSGFSTGSVSKVADGVSFVSASDSHTLFLRSATSTALALQPLGGSIPGGQSSLLTAVGAGVGPMTYQWYRGAKGDTSDPVSGATGAVLNVPALTVSQTYWVRVNGANGTIDSDAANVSVSSGRTIPPAPSGGKLIGISTRAFIGTGNDLLVGGLGISGGPTKILARVSGPLLSKYGLTNALTAPRLKAISGSTTLAENTAWGSNANAAEISTLAAQIGLAPFDTGSKDAALLLTLDSGAYSLHVEGATGGTGVALLEVYRIQAGSTGRLIGLASRGRVGTGNDVLIAGFAVEGDTQVLVRGVGPKLLEYGVTNCLVDPTLEVYSGPTLMDRATDWSANYSAAEIAPIFARLGQQPLTVGSKDSATITTIRDGNRTALVKGVDDGTGVAITEIYLVEP